MEREKTYASMTYLVLEPPYDESGDDGLVTDIYRVMTPCADAQENAGDNGADNVVPFTPAKKPDSKIA